METYNGTRTTDTEGLARADEETSSNGTTYKNRISSCIRQYRRRK
jgi:hypothetical protein